MRKIIPVHSVLGSYSVEMIDDMSNIISLIDSPKTLTFIDQNVQELYSELRRDTNISVECIESNKTLHKAEELLQRMLDIGVKSNWHVVIIGGGILQDLAGFCCSIYNRGLSYTYVPTTLLAQADSCIGGKTSINFNGKKNVLGTFYPPKHILINTDFLNTLTSTEYVSGMGEIFKFHILQSIIEEFETALDSRKITDTVYNSLQFKNSILLLDEFDKKERKFLNFGHTFGHALEFTSNNAIPHGIAVIVGSVVSCIISEKIGYTVPNLPIVKSYAQTLVNTGEIKLEREWFDYTQIMEAVKLDKKNTGEIVDVLIDSEPVLTTLTNHTILQESLEETFKLFNI